MQRKEFSQSKTICQKSVHANKCIITVKNHLPKKRSCKERNSHSQKSCAKKIVHANKCIVTVKNHVPKKRLCK